jgi:hypothetical protein
MALFPLQSFLEGVFVKKQEQLTHKIMGNTYLPLERNDV